jgi:hypothetical protein
MIEYIVQLEETFKTIANKFFGDGDLHAASLASINKKKVDDKLENGQKIKIPPDIHSPNGKVKKDGITYLKVKVKARTIFEGSVGNKGENKPESVKRVKQRLKDLGYPVSEVDEKCGDDTVKAIQLFQVNIKENWIIGQVFLPDGLIEKDQKTEKNLFADDAPKYELIPKGKEKDYNKSTEKKKDDALKGQDKDLKEKWQKIEDVWKEVSPYLPDGTIMYSGYRSKEDQRDELYGRFNEGDEKKYIELIKPEGKMTSKEVYNDCIAKIKDRENQTDSELDKVDLRIHYAVKKISGEIALPGKSPHQSGKAIDTQISDTNRRLKALLWYWINFPDKKHVVRIFNEKNKCIHFEFAQ